MITISVKNIIELQPIITINENGVSLVKSNILITIKILISTSIKIQCNIQNTSNTRHIMNKLKHGVFKLIKPFY